MNGKNKHDEFLLFTLHAFLENSSDMIFIKDINLHYVGASHPFIALVGLEKQEDLIGKTDYDIFDLELADRYTADDKKLLKEGIPFINYIEPLPEQDGKERYASSSKYIIKDHSGASIGLYGISRDITVQIELEEEKERLEQSNKLFSDIFEADITDNKILRIETSRFKLSPNCSLTCAIEEIASTVMHPDYASEFKDQYSIKNLTSLYESGIKEFSHITRQKFPDTDYRWVEITTRLYYSRISNTLRLTSFLKDLDEEIRSRERLQLKASTDALTGLLNRKSVVEKINDCIAGYGSSNTHALLFIDLDYFKQINDRFGHPFGDKILKETAQRLNTLFRQDDIVGRVGGDEFLALLKNVPNREIVEAKAEKILKALLFNQKKGETTFCVTCSIGISMYEGNGKRFDQLYEEADQAMYKAKNSGKKRIAFYE